MKPAIKALALSALLLATVATAAPAAPVQVPPLTPVSPSPSVLGLKGPLTIDLQDVSLSKLLHLVFREISPASYVLAPDVVADARPVSLRWVGKPTEVQSFLVNWLDSLGYSADMKTGVLYIAKKIEVIKPEKIEVEEPEPVVYYPKHQSPTSLRELVQGVMGPVGFAGARGVPAGKDQTPPMNQAPQGSAGALIDRDDRVLMFTGTQEQRTRLSKLLELLDTPSAVVNVQGAIFEVNTTQSTGSAFTLAASILGGRFAATIGGTNAGSGIGVSIGGIQAAISALSSDSRFRVISSPNMMVRSGASARLTVGQEVPTAGAVTLTNGGSQRSVEYRPSGVIFELSPQVMRDTVRLKVSQTVSSFAKTETGVNDSPTLLKREAKTDLDIRPGQVFVIGGLLDSNEVGTRSGLPFLPDWTHSNSKTETRSELLVMLQVDEVKSSPGSAVE